jgi:3-oxoadipate enol-lactonase
MAFAELDSVRVHYELDEDADLPVLVLSHSLGVNLRMWDTQVAALAPHFRLLRYDLRGHGASSVPEGQYSVPEMGEDVLRLLDVLQIERVSFCGLSVGGAIGQWLGIHARERLHKLVLANTAVKIGNAETWNARIELVGREGLEPVISGTLGRWFTPAFLAAHMETVAEVAAMFRATSMQGYVAGCAAVRDANFRTDAGKINLPTLIIAGKEDPATPPPESKFLADSIPGASYIELPAAHLSSVECAPEFNAALIRFLKS